MYCRNCGRELKDNYMFCPECGKKIPVIIEETKPIYAYNPITNVKIHKTLFDYINIILCSISLLLAIIPIYIDIIYIGLVIAFMAIIFAIIRKVEERRNYISVNVIIISITSVLILSGWILFYQLLL